MISSGVLDDGPRDVFHEDEASLCAFDDIASQDGVRRDVSPVIADLHQQHGLSSRDCKVRGKGTKEGVPCVAQ